MTNLLYNLAQPFSDTKQYTQGAIVIYNDRMYEMTADEYTPGAFNPEKFTERFLSEMISGKLNSNLKKLDSGVVSLSTSSTTKVTLGYKPSLLIIIMYLDGISITSNETFMGGYYDSEVSTDTILVGTASNIVPNNGYNRLNSIDDDGFTIGKSATTTTYKYCKYYAVK